MEEQSPDGRQQRGARPRLIKGRFRRRARDIAEEQLAHVGLGDKMSSHPEALSGRQQQRLAIARALAKGMTMICVTHEVDFERDTPDRVAPFHKGVIEEFEAPSEIFGNPKSEHLKEFLANTC